MDLSLLMTVVAAMIFLLAIFGALRVFTSVFAALSSTLPRQAV